ncbi:MAG TPA: YIP1 family protein [Myxococcota bacterium]|nr:YIP1 family protein [Myxococcota bacterium]
MSPRLQKPVLARCVSCGRNFETRETGQIACPACHTEIFLETPAGAEFEDDPPAEPSEASSPVSTAAPAAPAEPVTEPVTEEEEQHQPSIDDIQALLQLRNTMQAAEDRTFRPAWEAGDGNPAGRLIKTIKQIFSNPNRFFHELALEGVWRPLLFAWIICSLAVLFFAIYGLWQLNRNAATLMNSLSLPPGEDPQQVIESLRTSLLFALYGSPIFGLINVLLSAGLYHLGIRLATERNAGLAATFRATAYGFAPLLLAAIPFIGHLVGGLWSLLLQIVALAHVHRVTMSRATVAVLLPVTGVMLLLYAVL